MRVFVNAYIYISVVRPLHTPDDLPGPQLAEAPREEDEAVGSLTISLAPDPGTDAVDEGRDRAMSDATRLGAAELLSLSAGSP